MSTWTNGVIGGMLLIMVLILGTSTIFGFYNLLQKKRKKEQLKSVQELIERKKNSFLTMLPDNYYGVVPTDSELNGLFESSFKGSETEQFDFKLEIPE